MYGSGVRGEMGSITGKRLEEISCKAEDITRFLNEQRLEKVCQDGKQLRIGCNILLV